MENKKIFAKGRSELLFFMAVALIAFPQISHAINFSNPLEFDTVEGVLASLLNTLQGIIVVLSIVFIVIGAIFYITSAGNEKQIESAKKAITASIIGLVIGIAAPSFLREISYILGWLPGEEGLSDALTLSEIVLNVLDFLLSIVGVLSVIMLVAAGVMYLTSAGNEKRIDTAKNMTTYAIIGIVIALAALVIVRQVATFFTP